MTDPRTADGAVARDAGGPVTAGAWPAVVERVPVICLAVAAGVLVVVPLLVLARTALEQGLASLLAALSSAVPAMGATLWTSIASTILALGMGTGLALLTERLRVPGRRGIRLAMLVAFVVPGYVAAIGWLAAYGPGGVLDDSIGVSLPALMGPLGIVAVLAVEAAPVVYLVVAAGLAARVEPDAERAARSAGAGPWSTFRTITLPLLVPAIAGAGAIAFVLGVTAFGVPAVLGIPARFDTMTTRIYRDLAFSSDPEAFTRALGLAIVLAVGATLVIVAADRRLGRRRADRSGAFAGPLGHAAGAVPPAAGEGDRSRLPAASMLALGLLAWALLLAVVVLPLLALLLTALTPAPGLDRVPANWSLSSFGAVLGGRTAEALVNSLLLAGAAAGGVILLSLLAVLPRRGARPGLTAGLLNITFALPGTTLAVAVLLAYGVALRDSLLIILVAYLAKFWALGYRPVAAGLGGIPGDAYRAARVSGAGPWATTRTILLPLLRPLVLAGGLIVFLFGLHEVTMSSLLYGPGSTTLAVVVLNLQQYGDTSRTAALALVLTALVLLAAVPLAGRAGGLASLGWGR